MRDAMRTQCETDMRFADATDGRTDERRSRITFACESNSRNAQEQQGEADPIVSVGDVLADVSLWPSGDRHPVVRHGDRAEIPTHVRAAVWFRDRGLCKLCGSDTPTDQPLHLDHITPWSAGGPDTTDNLRLLCERHNLERSNFDDGTRQARPATWWCINCYSREGYGWEYVGGFVRCLMHPRGLGCRVGNRYQREAIAGGEVTNWHEREPIVHASVLAYCAHCDAPGMTDQPL